MCWARRENQKSNFGSWRVNLTLNSQIKFLILFSVNSFISSENLVLDQLIIPKLIFFFILITYLVDIVLIL